MVFIFKILSLGAAIFIVAQILPGVRIKNFGTALGVAVVYSIINFFLWWLLVFLTLPAVILTLGLFIFVINGFLLYLTDRMIDGFEIDGFGTTMIAAFLISIINALLKWLIW